MNDAQYAPSTHLLLDMWGAQKLTDIEFIAHALTQAAKECDATILDTKFHSFGENGGVTGVAILAESHISIHTWPEINFAAIDIFMCGTCDAEKAVPSLKNALKPTEVKIKRYKRGVKEQ